MEKEARHTGAQVQRVRGRGDPPKKIRDALYAELKWRSKRENKSTAGYEHPRIAEYGLLVGEPLRLKELHLAPQFVRIVVDVYYLAVCVLLSFPFFCHTM